MSINQKIHIPSSPSINMILVLAAERFGVVLSAQLKPQVIHELLVYTSWLLSIVALVVLLYNYLSNHSRNEHAFIPSRKSLKLLTTFMISFFYIFIASPVLFYYSSILFNIISFSLVLLMAAWMYKRYRTSLTETLNA